MGGGITKQSALLNLYILYDLRASYPAGTLPNKEPPGGYCNPYLSR